MRLAVSLIVLFTGLPTFAAESDALAVSANIQARHFPYGTVIDPVYATATSDQISGYTRCGDSALWTGHYLAAEAFRYKVTQSADALTNVTKAIAGLKSLADVTGNNMLARCIVPLDSPYAAGIQQEEAANGIYKNSPWFWVGNVSRDQYAGTVFGLGVAYDMIDDPTIKQSISDLLTRVVEYPRGHDWNMPEPDGSNNLTFIVRPDFISAFLQVARHVNPTRFNSNTIQESILLATPVTVPIAVDTLNDDSYFKFNLDYINFYNLVRLNPNQGSTDSKSAYNSLRNHTASHLNAFFDVVDRGLNGPNPTRDAETLMLLDQWLLRTRRDPTVDLTSKVPVCNGQACQPIPVPLRIPTDFLWQRSPFQLTGGGLGTIETAGIDYILPYWMSRYYGVGASFMVQSAAANSMVVAPESIASMFGPNLATQTAQASSQPLPSTLGGVTLNIKDAAGNQATAPLSYVSPSQINFEVPKGVASGVATFTITNGTASLSATANVQNVAPTLFSMNGKGTGVAAANAVQVQAGNPQVQGPVQVFQCVTSGCTATPIALGVDTPIYLILYGTGIRNVSSPSKVTATVNSISVPVSYAGPQPTFMGLDQVNVLLTLNLRGAGEVPIVITVDGQSSNAVTVNIQ